MWNKVRLISLRQMKLQEVSRIQRLRQIEHFNDIRKRVDFPIRRLRACLRGCGGPQVGEVTRLSI